MYIQSIMCCSIYGIVTFLVARKKPSHFHSDLSYAINAKTLLANASAVQCSADAPNCALIKRCNGIEQEQILPSKVLCNA
jgi:hypothetical protein